MQTVKDLRESFTSYFRERGHKIVQSSSLYPKDDPTLLFTTAGMVQFKPMFAGTVDIEYTRAATVQKCLRTSDLENVGKTKRHLTFFEMLGNFSFGDYFKKESVEYAWEYSTDVIGFEKDSIWISIYEDDDEAYEIWNKHIGVPGHKIVRLGKKDNFWGPAGDSGACGPCSELYIDRGPDFGCGSDDCRPGCDCERFLEYWNLVFNQFNQDIDGNLTPLPRTGIDTGMGLERLASLVQNVESVYETDELRGLIEYICRERDLSYEGDIVASLNIMADHARALTFAMSDGIFPSNEGRGYVLRRILRRALRFSRQAGIHEPFIFSMVDPVFESLKSFYPELDESRKNVKSVIEAEEKRFLETLENGLDRLDEIIKAGKKSGSSVLSGKEVFVLYDTFGFPVEMTVEIADEQGMSVDLEEYEKEMALQRERGKQSWKGSDSGLESLFEELAKETGDTVFTGYEENVTSGAVTAIATRDGMIETISEGDTGFIVMDRTSFYGESGGQVGDSGKLTGDDGSTFAVHDTKKFNKTVIHVGQVSNGNFRKGDRVTASIEVVNRNLTRANHTATHLLQASLRNIVGPHVKQAGSMVAPDRLRFDFSHFNALSDEEINTIEGLVNEKIWENIDVSTEVKNIDDAVKDGAIAVFDEKYEDIVRVITIDGFSKELCGGTHVSNTGNIGVFKILKESSPGAGMRRIEAVTLKGVLERLNTNTKVIDELTETLNVSEKGIVKKISDLIERNRALEKEKEKLARTSVTSNVDEILQDAREVNGVRVVIRTFENMDAGKLRDLSDAVRAREQNSLVLFGSSLDGKALLLYAATGNVVKKGIDCGALIKETSGIVGGGGGGRKDMAQAGGKSPESLEKALEEAARIAESALT